MSEVVTVTLLSEESEINVIYELLSIDIRREVNRIPSASLVLLDGDAARQKLDMSNARYFEPGKQIEIRLRYEKKPDETVFKGLVVRHGFEASAQGSLLRIELKDAAVKLTQTRKSAVFVNMDDGEVITKLVKDKNRKLELGSIEATPIKHAQIVQYYCTDWDFIVSRAESLGLFSIVEDGNVSVRQFKLTENEKPKDSHTFNYGINNIYDLEFELDANDQYSTVQSSSWDVKEGKLSGPTEAKVFDLKQGNMNGAKLAADLGFEPYTLSDPVPLAAKEQQTWADARLMRSRLSMIRGRLSVPGFAEIRLLDVIEIQGTSERFNGKKRVTGLCHRIDVNGWRTDIQFGLSAQPFAQQEAIQDAPAAGLLPGISGLHIGIVDKFEADPDKQFRVKVILPGIDEKTGSVWARLAAPDAGKNHGWFFRPQTGDEVVVGFFNNDPRQPVILGAMFSPKNTPPENFSEITPDNKTKAIVSKTGSAIGFMDDQKGSIFIETAEGARVLLDDSAKSMELTDQHGNQIKMDENGITLKTAKDLNLQAGGNVEIKGAKVNVV